MVKRGKHRIGGLVGIAAAALVAGGAGGAYAQQTNPAPTPTPLPSSARPGATTLPNVTPERFTLGPPAATPAPTPTPVPTVAPVPVPTPSASAAQRATAPARPTPTPTATATPSARPTPSTQPAPAASGSPVAVVPNPTPVPAAPVAVASPHPLPDAAVSASSGMPGWLWALLGAGATAIVFGAAWALQRRRRVEPEDDVYEAPVPAAAPSPPVPARPVAPPPGIAPPPPPPTAPSGEPFEVLLRPGRIEVTERDVVLDFELLIGNTHPAAAENIRVLMAMMSANPDQDRNIAGYHANPMVDPGGNPFDLAAGAGGRMPARLALPRELIHVVQVHGRPMFVPMVMVELKWRSGISLRRFGADFMVGTPGQGGKLGPIWLDRNQQASQLTATRYLPRQAVAA